MPQGQSELSIPYGSCSSPNDLELILRQFWEIPGLNILSKVKYAVSGV